MMLFYRLDRAMDDPAYELPPGIKLRLWHPATQGFAPRGSRTVRNVCWWLIARLGLFAGPDFTEITLWGGGKLLHRLIVTPRWLRFPFMAANDLQLGDLRTDVAARGRGLARAAIAFAHRRFPGRRFWYLASADNLASVRLVESCGYRLVGTGRRTSPLGLRIAGRFLLESPAA